MKYMVVYAHPNPKSFSHAIKERIEQNLQKHNREYVVRDLYAMKFDPILAANDFIMMKQGKLDPIVKQEQDNIRQSDAIIFIHPIWWFNMPAMLKGYVDRVFSNGFAYESTSNGLKGLLPGKKVFIFNTTGGEEEAYKKNGFNDAIRQTIDIGTFGLCAMDVVLHKYFYAVPFATDDTRKAMLEELDSIRL